MSVASVQVSKASEAVDPRPPVILIVGESLRADHVGAYGYGRDTTPNVDGLADHSLLFSNAYAPAPCTNPAMADILVSRYQTAMPLPDRDVTLAEYFSGIGYRTGAVVEKNPFLAPETWNLDQGFDSYDYSRYRDAALPATDRAVEWIERNRQGPFFLWVFYYAPHRPYAPPPPFRGYYTREELSSRNTSDLLASARTERRRWRTLTSEQREFLIGAYDEEIRYLDHEVGRLLAYLKERGLFEKSLVVFTADHGEELGDNGGLWDHCNILSQEEIRVPLILKMPGREKGRQIDTAVQTIDLFPTLTEIIGGKGSSTGLSLQGKSLTPVVEGHSGSGPRYAASFWKDSECLVVGNYKYCRSGDEVTLKDVRSGVEARVGQEHDKYQRLMDLVIGESEVENDFIDDALRRMRSLGYFR